MRPRLEEVQVGGSRCPCSYCTGKALFSRAAVSPARWLGHKGLCWCFVEDRICALVLVGLPRLNIL